MGFNELGTQNARLSKKRKIMGARTLSGSTLIFEIGDARNRK